MLAHVFLTVTSADPPERAAGGGLIPLKCNKIRYLPALSVLAPTRAAM
jgi:hypothetical protein